MAITLRAKSLDFSKIFATFAKVKANQPLNVQIKHSFLVLGAMSK